MEVFVKFIDFIFKDGLTFWTAILACFAIISTFWNSVVAISILITVIFAFKNWKQSLNNDKYLKTSQLSEEFDKRYKEIFEIFSYKKIEVEELTEQDKEKTNKESYRLILFLSKLGYLLKNKIIDIECLFYYFSSHLFYKDSVKILIENLKIFTPQLLLKIKRDFNYLLNQIGKYADIDEFENLIYKNFGTTLILKLKDEIFTLDTMIKEKS